MTITVFSVIWQIIITKAGLYMLNNSREGGKTGTDLKQIPSSRLPGKIDFNRTWL